MDLSSANMGRPTVRSAVGWEADAAIDTAILPVGLLHTAGEDTAPMVMVGGTGGGSAMHSLAVTEMTAGADAAPAWFLRNQEGGTCRFG